MAGIIKLSYDLSDVDDFILEAYRQVFAFLAQLGQSAYETAVQEGKYNNITGNLRSSLGYVISMDGKIVKEGGFKRIDGRGENYEKVFFTTRSQKTVQFWAKGKSGDGSEGSRQGLSYARDLASKHTKGVTLVVVAGMDYASYVNDIHKLNVIDTAEAKVIAMLQ